MSDDLVKVLRRPFGNLAAERIEELEEKLAKAVETLEYIADTLALHSAKETLAELKGYK